MDILAEFLAGGPKCPACGEPSPEDGYEDIEGCPVREDDDGPDCDIAVCNCGHIYAHDEGNPPRNLTRQEKAQLRTCSTAAGIREAQEDMARDRLG